jgi:hypothetical protein
MVLFRRPTEAAPSQPALFADVTFDTKNYDMAGVDDYTVPHLVSTGEYAVLRTLPLEQRDYKTTPASFQFFESDRQFLIDVHRALAPTAVDPGTADAFPASCPATSNVALDAATLWAAVDGLLTSFPSLGPSFPKLCKAVLTASPFTIITARSQPPRFIQCGLVYLLCATLFTLPGTAAAAAAAATRAGYSDAEGTDGVDAWAAAARAAPRNPAHPRMLGPLPRAVARYLRAQYAFPVSWRVFKAAAADMQSVVSALESAVPVAVDVLAPAAAAAAAAVPADADADAAAAAPALRVRVRPTTVCPDVAAIAAGVQSSSELGKRLAMLWYVALFLSPRGLRLWAAVAASVNSSSSSSDSSGNGSASGDDRGVCECNDAFVTVRRSLEQAPSQCTDDAGVDTDDTDPLRVRAPHCALPPAVLARLSELEPNPSRGALLSASECVAATTRTAVSGETETEAEDAGALASPMTAVAHTLRRGGSDLHVYMSDAMATGAVVGAGTGADAGLASTRRDSSTTRLGASALSLAISLGFSDDDPKNVAVIHTLFEQHLASLNKHVRFVVYDAAARGVDPTKTTVGE